MTFCPLSVSRVGNEGIMMDRIELPVVFRELIVSAGGIDTASKVYLVRHMVQGAEEFSTAHFNNCV